MAEEVWRQSYYEKLKRKIIVIEKRLLEGFSEAGLLWLETQLLKDPSCKIHMQLGQSYFTCGCLKAELCLSSNL